MKNLILTFLISMAPVVELRAAIPFGVANGLTPFIACIVSIIGNLIPVPFIILFVRKIFQWMKKRSRWLGNLAEKFEAKAEKKKDKVLKGEFWGLMILVAIPLPGTGAWTGATVAAMLDMRLKSALPAIFVGVITAGIIVTLATMGVIAII